MTNLLINPDFQEPNFLGPDGEPHWFIDGDGNQTPPGWTREFTRPGSLLEFDTKHYYEPADGETKIAPALASAVPEDVHKLAVQLPPDEQPGQPNQLIFPGRDKVYKRFGNQGAIGGTLRQAVDAPPNSDLVLTAFLFCDAPDIPTAPYGLENDHALVWLSVNESVAIYDYLYLSTHFDVDKVTRPWCRLTCLGKADQLGTALVEIGVQKNWPGPTAFFFGPTSLEVVSPPDDDLRVQMRRHVDDLISLANRMKEELK